MKLRDSFNGDAPFEGDRALRWRSIPANARIVSATAIVTPIDAKLGSPFTEVIRFKDGTGEFGATKSAGSASGIPWVEVDLHNRRTLAGVVGSFGTIAGSNGGSILQIDVGGGTYVEINQNGAFRTPSNPPDSFFLIGGNTAALPGLTVAKLKLTNRSPSPAPPPTLTALVVRSVPSQVSLRVGELSPFWTHTGEMTEAETTPDFAAVLQAALATAEVKNGFYDLPLVIHSESIARLKVELLVDVHIQQDALPPGLKEIVLPFDFSTLPQSSAAILNVAVPPNSRVVPEETTARVKGAFAETRIAYGPTGTVNPVAAVEVSPACSQAQIIAFKPGDKDILATAIDLFIEPVTSTVRLRLDIRGDLDGKPADSSLLAAPVELTLDQQAAKGARWTSAPLPAEFLFMKAQDKSIATEGKPTRYWVVLQSLLGAAAWSVEKTQASALADKATADVPNMQCTRDSGLSWRDTTALAGSLKDSTYPAAGPYTALLRLRRLPAQFKVPIELQVGSGTKEVRVKLDRFEPLGRVDFAINTELAQGINTFLANTASASSPETEHLVNPQFEHWQKIGDALTARPTIPFGARPLEAVAFAPDGALAYVLDQSAAKKGFLLVVDVACNKEIKEKNIELGMNQPRAFVISPDGTRAYVTNGNELRVVNLVSNQVVGGLINLDLLSNEHVANDLALSPDGQRLYVATLHAITETRNRIRIIDTARLEQQIVDGPLQTGMQTVTIATDVAGQQESPNALAVSPDGSLLYMLTGRGESQSLVEILDTTSFVAVASSPVRVGFVATTIALSPDGTRAVVTNSADHNVSIINTTTRTVSTIAVGQSPFDVAISPEGTRAYVLNQTSRSISIIDLSQQTVIRNFALEPAPATTLARALALAPQGEQIYVANLDTITSGNNNKLSSIQVGTRLPAEWQTTSGAVIPYCLPQPFHLAAILGSDTLPTGLSQVVPVVEASTYEFSFWGLAAEPQAEEPPAVGEVLWLNNACGEVQPNPPVPIKLVEDQTDLRAIIATPVGAPSAVGTVERKVPLVLHRARMNSPAGTTQAEVRFRVPKGGVAAIDLVSLAVTSELAANADFKLQKDGLLSDWTLSPKVAPGFVLVAAEDGIQLTNAGAATVELVQRIAAKSGEPFTLEFQGKAAAPSSPTQTNQSVEVRWLKADATSTGTPTVVEIPPDGSDSSVASGTVPMDATQAEIHLVVPARTSLKVKRVSLRYSKSTTVPVTFIAEAPGEMTVADVRIAFEQVEPTRPPIPAQGLCIPTPPGRQPGQTGGDCGFCHQCESEQTMIDPKPTVTMGDRPAIVGRCATCKEEMLLIGGTHQAHAQPLFDAPRIAQSAAVVGVPAEAMMHTADMAMMESVTPAMDTAAMNVEETPAAEIADERKQDASISEITRIPLSVLVKARIKGIGEARSQQLAQIGINSLEELAAAKPDQVSQIKGISVAIAAGLINQANAILASERKDKESA